MQTRLTPIIFLRGLEEAPAGDEHMDDYEQCKSIVRDFNEGVNTGDKETLFQVMDDDYVLHSFQGTFEGKDAFYEGLQDMRKAFPDLTIRIENQVADDDYVVNRVHMTGTHDGEFAGIPPTHQRVETTGLAMFKFKKDKIAEHWAEWNVMGMLAQVGAKPMRPQDC
jgi:steroid delta-isomerase-like uncharacterized protein